MSDSMRDILMAIVFAFTVLGVVWAPVSCVRQTDEKILEAIKAGTPANEAYCAFSNSSNQMCR